MSIYNRRVLDKSVKGDQKSDLDFRIISALQSLYESAIITLYEKIDIDRRVFTNNTLIRLYGAERVSASIKTLKSKGFLSGVEYFIAYKDKSLCMIMDKDFLKMDFKDCLESNYLKAYISNCEKKFNIGKYWVNRKRSSTYKIKYRTDILFKINFSQYN